MKSVLSILSQPVRALLLSLALAQQAHSAETPVPSGPQTDGAFRKVILDADRSKEPGATIDDTIIDPMELE